MRCVVYNPMQASYWGRLTLILTAFVNAQIIALPGTKVRPHAFQPPQDTVHSERYRKFIIYEWHAAETEFSNSSCGVTIAIDTKFVHSRFHQVFSPPDELQGRGGAIVCEKGDSSFQMVIMCLYLPASGTAAFLRTCDTKLFEWAQSVLNKVTAKARVYLLTDANARVGLQLVGREWKFQTPRHIGPIDREQCNINGECLSKFIAANELCLVNTFISDGCSSKTYFGWGGSQSRIDYVAIRCRHLGNVSKCEIWRRTARTLQLAKVPQIRDHAPLVITEKQNFSMTGPRRVVWNFDLLRRSPDNVARARSFVAAVENWISEENISERLQYLALDKQVDDSWLLLSSGINSNAEVFQKPSYSPKFLPSDLTLFNRSWRQFACEKREEHFVCLRGHPELIVENLSAILNSWLWTERFQYWDKRLGESRRHDRQDWKRHWDWQLNEAIAHNKSGEAWKISQKIAGTGLTRHRRFVGHVSPSAPSTQVWSQFLQKHGTLGGAQAKEIATEIATETLPFADVLDHLAAENQSYVTIGGGRGAFAFANSSVPNSILKARSEQHIALKAIQEANDDLERFCLGVKNSTTGKAVPAWSVPAEVWKLLLLGWPDVRTCAAVKKCVWLFFLALRRAQCPPIRWNVSQAIAISKFNGLSGCEAQRLIHLLDPAGKNWMKEIWREQVCCKPTWSFGFAKHRRREQPLMQHRIIQHRALKAHFHWGFRKYDVKNAFGSIAWNALDNTVLKRAYDPENSQLIRARYRRAFMILDGSEGKQVLLQNGTGCFPGDGSAPDLFSESFDDTIENWTAKCEMLVHWLKLPPLTIENTTTGMLHKEATTTFADDLGRALIFFTVQDVKDQIAAWDYSLVYELKKINLVPNQTKTKIVLSTWSPEIIKELSLVADDFLRDSLKTRVKYLGGYLDWKGDLSCEVHERLQAASRAWKAFGSFWSRSAVQQKIRISVFKAVVRTTLLTGLEAVALSREMIHLLETFQNKHLRKLLCGGACIKKEVITESGEKKLIFHALSNATVRKQLGVHTVFSELSMRRVRWLQQMVRFPRDSSSTLAILQDSFLWESEPPIGAYTGKLHISANPWTKQFYGDLQRLAKVDAEFDLLWKRECWWSIYSESFIKVRASKIRSFLDYDFDEFSVCTHETLCSGMSRLQPYIVTEKSVQQSVISTASAVSEAMAKDKVSDDDMGSWMQMPVPPNGPPRKAAKQQQGQDIASTLTVSGSGGSGGGGKGGKSKGLGKGKGQASNTRLVKAALNLDARLRIVEGILNDAVEVPDTLGEAQAAVAAGPAYYETVQAMGRGHSLGPPHLRVWAEFIKSLKAAADIPMQLAFELGEHAASCPDYVALARYVRHFTARRHHDKSMIVISVSLSEKLADLWHAVKTYLISKGAKQHIGPPPRGPIFRELAAENM
eukprot:TRINITY_DN14246_c0_g1_i1.p1 TRINITY_DN14246_c0_g1~~TRINITY_DN14246_c0_g1_i1.p1  ORF type:complete len:1411 (-),score=180.44 TRINITY_DN14246_c0_g1_i1:1000-5232(-)